MVQVSRVASVTSSSWTRQSGALNLMRSTGSLGTSRGLGSRRCETIHGSPKTPTRSPRSTPPEARLKFSARNDEALGLLLEVEVGGEGGAGADADDTGVLAVDGQVQAVVALGKATHLWALPELKRKRYQPYP